RVGKAARRERENHKQGDGEDVGTGLEDRQIVSLIVDVQRLQAGFAEEIFPIVESEVDLLQQDEEGTCGNHDAYCLLDAIAGAPEARETAKGGYKEKGRLQVFQQSELAVDRRCDEIAQRFAAQKICQDHRA